MDHQIDVELGTRALSRAVFDNITRTTGQMPRLRPRISWPLIIGLSFGGAWTFVFFAAIGAAP